MTKLTFPPREDRTVAAAPERATAKDRTVRDAARQDARTRGRAGARLSGMPALVIAAALLSVVLTSFLIARLDLSLLWAVPIYGVVGALLVLGLAAVAARRGPSDRER